MASPSRATRSWCIELKRLEDDLPFSSPINLATKDPMGQQSNKIEKRRRREAYLKRKKAAETAKKAK